MSSLQGDEEVNNAINQSVYSDNEETPDSSFIEQSLDSNQKLNIRQLTKIEESENSEEDGDKDTLSLIGKFKYSTSERYDSLKMINNDDLRKSKTGNDMPTTYGTKFFHKSKLNLFEKKKTKK